MNTSFHLFDLRSQAEAVRQHLFGKPPQEVLTWLGTHGTVTSNPRSSYYSFESSSGVRSAFCFRDGTLFVPWEDQAG